MTAFQVTAGDVQRASRIDSDMASMQRQVSEYLGSGDPAARKKIDDDDQAIKDRIKRAATSTGSLDGVEAFKSIDAAADDYHRGFDRIVELMRARPDRHRDAQPVAREHA